MEKKSLLLSNYEESPTGVPSLVLHGDIRNSCLTHLEAEE
jgi:hypothetical protein